MKTLFFLILLSTGLLVEASGQSAISCTNPLAEQAMLGNYSHQNWYSTTPFNYDDTISRGISLGIAPDSLHAYLEVLRSFKNRNTGSDTLSNTKGIGAARRWIYQQFSDFSARAGGRLIPAYLQFSLPICGQNLHRNILAVLPGTDTTDKAVVVAEAHIDSRCAGACDTSCLAEGMEDNGSGTALIMELARVMSRYKYRRTIVFAIVIGEEQGLYGGKALADYLVQKGIKVHATLNNDVIGGIVCGQTSSPPSCPGLNAIDSTNVRIFSYGSYNSLHKQLARYVKLEYDEQCLGLEIPRKASVVTVPMNIHIMSDEDRIGRGGDHIPFRQNGFRAIRLTSANEHGDANVNAAGYTDRQHTSSDILGIDRNNDGKLDSFFVDFNYLARNTVINGNALAMAAIAPKTPSVVARILYPSSMGTEFTFSGVPEAVAYRIAVRTVSNDWDVVYRQVPNGYLLDTVRANQILSYAAVDTYGVESLFTGEEMLSLGVAGTGSAGPVVELLQNKPNPFDETTTISVYVRTGMTYHTAFIEITDNGNGKIVSRLPVSLKQPGIAEVVYKHGYQASGSYTYALVIDGKRWDAKKMVFAN